MKTFIVFVALCQLAFGLPQLAFQGGHDGSSSSDTVPKPISSSQPKPSINQPSKPLIPSDQGTRQGAQAPPPGSPSSGISPSKPFNGSPIQPSASGSGSFGSSSSGISSSGSSSIGNGRPIPSGSSSGSFGSASEIQETVVRPIQPVISGSKQAPSAPVSSGSSGTPVSSGAAGASGASAPKPKPPGADQDDAEDDERERRALSDPVTVKPSKPEVSPPKGVKTPVDRVAATDKPEDDDDIKTDAPRKSFFPSRN